MKLTQEYVQELFCYDYDTGKLYWKVSNNRRIKIGAEVGSINSHGYLTTVINKKPYRLHRLIFLYHYGYMPENDIDHEDRIRINNRIDNIREISKSCNVKNQGIKKTNTSGIKGIDFIKGSKRWRARIESDKKVSFLGSYSILTEAVYARYAAEQCSNYNQCDSNSSAYQYIRSLNNNS